MSRVLLDQNVPVGLRHALVDHDVTTARHLGWHELHNGDLIAQAERASFDVMITCDQGIRYQQNLSRRRLALVVLSTNDWSRVSLSLAHIAACVAGAAAGSLLEVAIGHPDA